MTRNQEWTSNIGCKHVVPLIFGNFNEWNSFKETGIIYQHVNAAKLTLYSPNSRSDAFRIAHVTMKRNCAASMFFEFGQRLLSFFCGVQISKSDLSAFPRDCQCNGAPQMDCAAGNHNRLALQTGHGCIVRDSGAQRKSAALYEVLLLEIREIKT